MHKPLVSVIIPTYNQPLLLREALDSVFAQTFKDFEIIIVNDGSTDDTLEQLARYHDRVRIITQENRGIGCARNRGMDAATGRYIAFLDHDDLWHPSKLEVQVAFMRAHTNCVGNSVPFAYSSSPNEIAFDLSIRSRDGIVPDPLQVLARGEIFLYPSALLIDRQLAGDLRFETSRQCFEDLTFQLRLLGRGQFGLAGDTILVTYRMHPGNTSKSPLHYENGTRHLREMFRTGAFDPLSEPDYRAIEEFISFFGRLTTVRLLKGGYKRRALRNYCREFPHQLRSRRVRFLLAVPLLWATPSFVLRQKWSGDT